MWKKGGICLALDFVVQMKGPARFRPNDATHPAFGAALREAAGNGVGVYAYDCLVTPDGGVGLLEGVAYGALAADGPAYGGEGRLEVRVPSDEERQPGAAQPGLSSLHPGPGAPDLHLRLAGASGGSSRITALSASGSSRAL
mgnify:CR=1 FL=1